MYQKGQFIIYGTNGVCRIEQIGPPPFDIEDNRPYYTLSPLMGSETIYVPVDSPVFMRPVLSRDEAEALIRQIPFISEEPLSPPQDGRQPAARYQAALQSHDCRDLIMLIKTVYNKCHGGRRAGQADQHYRKRAEALLHGELAVALGIPIDQVPPYIQRTITHLA